MQINIAVTNTIFNNLIYIIVSIKLSDIIIPSQISQDLCWETSGYIFLFCLKLRVLILFSCMGCGIDVIDVFKASITLLKSGIFKSLK